MIDIRNFVQLGISSILLYPKALKNSLSLFTAIEESCHLEHFEVIESYLPHEKDIRSEAIKTIKETGRTIHYNSPLPFQLDGPYSCGSSNAEYRKNSFKLIKQHIEYAAEADAPLFVLTGCIDKGEEERAARLSYLEDFICYASEEAVQHGIKMVLEPIERHQFKKIVLGPTEDCVSMAKRVMGRNIKNFGLMLDVMHLPLMEETFDHALENILETGLDHVHMGDCVTDPSSSYYGHTHPPFGIQKGTFNQQDYSYQFFKFLECGYLSSTPSVENKPTISIEAQAYPGVSPRTSSIVFYEKLNSAFADALVKFKNQ
ncbi:TIM barrel protein [Oceanispirochaeta crateris]|nr:TIM barrel protein [Oceanispirochaeta crateris]